MERYEQDARRHPMLRWLRLRFRSAELLRQHVRARHDWRPGWIDELSDDTVRVDHWRDHRPDRAPFHADHEHRRLNGEVVE